jgi:signal transduction histidine kinase
MLSFKLLVSATVAAEASATATAADGSPLTLTRLRQVLDLGLDGVRQHSHPVETTGVVTMVSSRVTVQDDTAACIVLATNQPRSLAPGQKVRVRGLASPAMLAPCVDFAQVEILGPGSFPEPDRPPVARLSTLEFYGRWVELDGVVRDVIIEPFLKLMLGCDGQRGWAHLPARSRKDLPVSWLDARVRLRGVCFLEVAGDGQPRGFFLHVPATNFVEILSPLSVDAFAQPRLPAGSRELKQASDFRLKTGGTVLHHSLDGQVFLRDNSGALRARLLVPFPPVTVRSASVPRPRLGELQPGAIIELVGAPTATAFAPSLLDAEARRMGTNTVPQPISIRAEGALSGRYDCDLVTLDARVIGRDTRIFSQARQEVLALQADGVSFEALRETPGAGTLPAATENTRVRLTGICLTRPPSPTTSRAFTLLLRQPSDLVVLGHAPVWESFQPGRILAVSGGLGALALIWIWVLRRQVGRRTAALAQANEQLQRAEVEARRSLAQEKELNELKSRFVSMVSHEFRTPLGIIMSSAEILHDYLDRLPADRRNEHLRDIAQSAKHMSGMMENVLLLGRVEAGRLRCNPAALDLAAFCQRLVDEVSSATGQRCPINLTVPTGLPNARGDEALLRHIFTNLLHNAVKYSTAGAAVEFRVEAREPLAVFTVRDRGIGIPEPDQRQLFQAFHRGRNVGDTPGTGLGMIIIKHCVQLHGGKIAFRSTEGEGTSFIVALPLFRAPEGDVATTTQIFRTAIDGQNATLIP